MADLDPVHVAPGPTFADRPTMAIMPEERAQLAVQTHDVVPVAVLQRRPWSTACECGEAILGIDTNSQKLLASGPDLLCSMHELVLLLDVVHTVCCW